jgi:hypothetical protein
VERSVVLVAILLAAYAYADHYRTPVGPNNVAQPVVVAK